MDDRVAAAERRLIERMAQARASHAGQRRFRSYVLPIGLMAGGLFASAEMGHQPTGALMPVAPLIVAAVFSRTFGGVTAARVAAAIALPIVAYIGLRVGAIWYWGEGAALIGLCAGASWLRGLRVPNRRSPAPRQSSTSEHRMRRLSPPTGVRAPATQRP